MATYSKNRCLQEHKTLQQVNIYLDTVLPWSFIASEIKTVHKSCLNDFSLLHFPKVFCVYCATILSSRPTAESLVLASSSSENVINPIAQTAIIYSHMSIKARNKRRSGSGDGRARARKSRQKGILDQLALRCPFPPQKSPCKHTVMKSKSSHLRAKAKVLCFASAYK